MASEIVPDARQREQILDHFQHLLSGTNVVSLAVRVRDVPTLVVGVISGAEPAAVPAMVTVEVTDSAGRKSVAELVTEVVAEGEIVTHLAQQAVPQAPLVVRPVHGGRAITASNLGRGTLGVNIVYRGGYKLISCAHVLTQYDAARIGSMIYEPAVINPANDLVPVTAQDAVTYYTDPNQQHPVENIMDVATADITPALGDPEIELLGIPAGIRAPVPAHDAEVTFYGAGSGLQARQVDDFAVRYRTPGKNSAGADIYTWWRDGMRYSNAGMGSRPADSGAALVSEHDQHVIGLHRAGSDQWGYACKLL